MKYLKYNYFKFIGLIFILVLFLVSCGNKNNPTSIEIILNQEEFLVDDTIELDALVYPQSADQSVTWSINDTNIASLNGNKLHLKDKGELVICATSTKDESISSTISIDIKLHTPTAIEVRTQLDSIYIGEETYIFHDILPANSDQRVKYQLRDNDNEKEVAKLEGNKLIGLNEGIAYVTVISEANNRISQMIQINVLHECVEDDVYLAEAIIGAPGEDASTMFNINYQITNTSSYVLYTTSDDVNFENAYNARGNFYYFADNNKVLAEPFEPRNVCRVVLEDLTPNTSYIYKINNGNNTYSDIYHFKTAGSDSTTFLYIADTHYYSGTTGTLASAAVSEEIIKHAIEQNPNLGFVLSGGDLIDTGGSDIAWGKFFEYALSLKQIPFVGVPGNHEYYMESTSMGDNRYFKAFTAGPRNGPASLNGSACWFIHNDTLFMLVDNIKGVDYYAQMDWMANLLETKEYKYSVVCFHAPVNQDTTDYDENFIKLFDKYSVDLVLSGHYHSENIQIDYYNNQKSNDPYLGTSYLTAGYSGIKGASTPENAINTARGYVIDITDECINIQVLYANGTLGKSWQIYSKFGAPVNEKSKDELLNSVKYNYNNDTTSATFNWSSDFYGNVEKVYISEVYRNTISDYAVFPTPSYTSLTLENIIPGYDYKFNVRIVFKDGSEEILTFTESLHTKINLNASINNNTLTINYDEIEEGFKYIVKKIKVYINDEYYVEYNYVNGLNAVTTYDIENIKSSSSYKVKIEATLLDGSIIFVEEVII